MRQALILTIGLAWVLALATSGAAHPRAVFGFAAPVEPFIVAPRVLVIPRGLVTAPPVTFFPQTMVARPPRLISPPVIVTVPPVGFEPQTVIVITPQTSFRR